MSVSSQDSLNVQERIAERLVSEWCNGKAAWPAISGFEDGKRPEAKGLRQFLEAGKDKVDCPLGSRKEPALLAPFDFNPWDSFSEFDLQNYKIEFVWF